MSCPTGKPDVPQFIQKEKNEQFVFVLQTPNMIMAAITAQTLLPVAQFKSMFNLNCKRFWGSVAVLSLIGWGYLFAPTLTANLVINVIRWRSSLFFLLGSFSLATSIHAKVNSKADDIKTPGETLQLIATSVNWLGLAAAVAAFVLVEFDKFLMAVPLLNCLMGSFFALSEIVNTVFEYKVDSDLIQSVKNTQGENKAAALDFLYSRRRINCATNVLKALSYMTFAIIPFLGLSNPISGLAMAVAVTTWIALLCVQQGVQMVKAKHYRSNRLFTEEDVARADEYKAPHSEDLYPNHMTVRPNSCCA